jgi:hypothetical protein
MIEITCEKPDQRRHASWAEQAKPATTVEYSNTLPKLPLLVPPVTLFTRPTSVLFCVDSLLGIDYALKCAS